MVITLLFCLSASSQGGCFDPLGQNFPSQQPTASPASLDPKLPTYPSQFTPASQTQFPPEMAAAGPQGLVFGAQRGAFPGGTTGMGLRPGGTRPQGMSTPLRLSPNQLRLQLQQRLQGPQQVRTQRRWFRSISCRLRAMVRILTPSFDFAPLPSFRPSDLSSRTGWPA